jgi:NAD(P)-dependent dehydrogenase (short-subunit alcohol dehydrogenase family)
MTPFSIAGHYDVSAPGFHMYSASKHGVTALTEGLRRELANRRSNIRVTVSTVAPLPLLPSQGNKLEFKNKEIYQT